MRKRKVLLGFIISVSMAYGQGDTIKISPPRQTIKLPGGKARPIPKGPYQPNWESIKAHYVVPEWLKDAKFGIFIHYGIYTVPAHGSEWYPHHMVTNPAFAQWHIEHYGPLDKFGYKDFIPMFKAEKFDPNDWADLFVRAGARYVIPTAEHHDGFAMYKSKLTRWNAKNMGPKRDFIGELGKAMRKRGLKYGISNHRMENWDFMYPTLKMKTDVFDPKYVSFYGPPQPPPQLKTPKANGEVTEKQDDAPQSKEFLEEWLARMQEIVDNYKPDMVYFDNGINSRKLDSIKLRFAAYYYNKATAWKKQVSITTKSDAYLAGSVKDFEREGRAPKELTDYYWQVDNPIADKFGYVEGMKVVSPGAIIKMLIENVSKNGNLMLNISPKSDGTIPDDQRQVLLGIGKWLGINGDAIYGTRPWIKYGEGNIRFTTKAKDFYAIFLQWPKDVQIVTIELLNSSWGRVKSINMLGNNGELKFTQDEQGLKVIFPDERPCDFAWSLKIERE